MGSGSADDVIAGYQSTTYHANGNKTLDVVFATAGADGLWFTEDDVPSGRVTYDPTR